MWGSKTEYVLYETLNMYVYMYDTDFIMLLLDAEPAALCSMCS